MSKSATSTEAQGKSAKPRVRKPASASNKPIPMQGKRVGGFLIFDTPIEPKHLTRAQIAAAIDRLR